MKLKFTGNSMPVRAVAMITIDENEPLALARYLEVTTPLLEAAGAQIINRFTLNEVVVGHKPAKTVVIVQYPSREAVSVVFDSQQYKDIMTVRDTAFLDYSVSIVADGDD
jgi:uncharacterized protein (DUF1330 family)